MVNFDDPIYDGPRKPLEQLGIGHYLNKCRDHDEGRSKAIHRNNVEANNNSARMFHSNVAEKQNRLYNQNHFGISKHSTNPSNLTGVTSLATLSYSLDESRDESIVVSRITDSGDKRDIHRNDRMSFDSNLNMNRCNERRYFPSLATQSTVFHDASSALSCSRDSDQMDYSPGKCFDKDGSHQHFRYYSDGSLASSSQYTHDSSIATRNMKDTEGFVKGCEYGYGYQCGYGYGYQYGREHSPQRCTTPTKYVTLLEDAKPFWSRVKSMFEGEKSSCREKGIFCGCIDATSSPSTAEKPKLQFTYDDRHDEYHYHSFKDLDQVHSFQSGVYEIDQGIRTVKKRNSMKLVNLGTTPDYRQEVDHEHAQRHKRIEGDIFLSPDEYDFHVQNETVETSPLIEERSKRRLFQTPSKGLARNEESPDSIPPEESPMSNINYDYSCSESDLDSYAGDVDNRSTCMSIDVETLGPVERGWQGSLLQKHASIEGSARVSSRNLSPKSSPKVNTKKKIRKSTSKHLQRPPFPFPSIGRQPSLANNNNNSPAISPMNTVGTNGTMHRRMKSTFSVNSLAQIFDESGQEFLSPKQKKGPAVIPKTVKTVKKNKNGQNDCDDISPLDDGECRVGFRDRMREIDIAIDDESLCSPIHGNCKGSFDFSQKITSVDLFGKENMVQGEEDPINNELQPLSLGRSMVLKRCPPSSVSLKKTEGTYLPISEVFQKGYDHNSDDIVFQGWVAYSKETKTKGEFLDGLKNKNKIKRKHLRYIMIEKNFMYVYSSKKQLANGEDDSNSSASTSQEKGAKKLKLSKHMTIELEDISRQHGQCIIIRDIRLKGVRQSDVVCTILPVKLTPDFFKDESYSQLIEAKEFDNIRHALFAAKPAQGIQIYGGSPGILKDITSLSAKSPHPDSVKMEKKNEWPITASEFVSIEQNVSTIHLQFALDGAKWYKPSRK